ncbi:hypothetical protein MAHJHV33_49960 [Mycobacterium avium subsp. hominissuis]
MTVAQRLHHPGDQRRRRQGAGGVVHQHERGVAGDGGQVQVVDGDPLAFKITTQLDLLLAETIVRR